MASNHKYETRLNGRGGWEIGILGDRAGSGEGNYPNECDAYAIARRNYEPREIKRGDELAAKPAPEPRLKPTGLRRLVKALTR